MKTLSISYNNAKMAFNKASDENKEFIKNLFPDQNFDNYDLDRIKSYEDACADQGRPVLDVSAFSALHEDDREYSFFHHRVTTIIRSLNRKDDGTYWVPDFNDSDQPKYYIWYEWGSSWSGFRFRDCYCVGASSGVGSRLHFKDKETALYFKDNFLSELNKYFTL